jgi:hypothetical protein
MKSVLLLFAMTMIAIAGSAVAQAQTATADAQTPFQFELAQADGLEGWESRGYVHNGLPWRITNVRLRVDTVDASGTVIASAVGWVLGDVKAGGRGYFYVPVSSAASAYRATVLSFDQVAVEAPGSSCAWIGSRRRGRHGCRAAYYAIIGSVALVVTLGARLFMPGGHGS